MWLNLYILFCKNRSFSLPTFNHTREEITVKPGQRTGTELGRTYLTPPVLSSKLLTCIYTRRTPEWDEVENEAVSLSRRALAGRMSRPGW